MNGLNETLTCVRERIPCTAVVFNNGQVSSVAAAVAVACACGGVLVIGALGSFRRYFFLLGIFVALHIVDYPNAFL
jgi:hypothetical protein